MMIPIPLSGTLVEVAGQDRARDVPGIGGLEITIARGRPVVALPEGDRYLGFLFAQGYTPDAVEASLREAHAHLRITIEPRAEPTASTGQQPAAPACTAKTANAPDAMPPR
jgi:hypothetical protein